MKNKNIYLPALLSLIVVVIIILALPIKKPKKEPLFKPVIGKIAIVLDDWGYTLNNVKLIEEINAPLTIAVLPGLAYSKKISYDLSKKGFEVILHLPMEPKEGYALEKETITTSMKEEEIKRIINQDLSGLYNVKGVSNHMGSKATSDKRTMEIVLSEIKKRNLFFLDSYVISTSKAREITASYGLRFAKRDIFLDNESSLNYIRKQLYKLRDLAKANGFAIGIGHDRKNTLIVLKEMIPILEKEGYKFVLISEIAR